MKRWDLEKNVRRAKIRNARSSTYAANASGSLLQNANAMYKFLIRQASQLGEFHVGTIDADVLHHQLEPLVPENSLYVEGLQPSFPALENCSIDARQDPAFLDVQMQDDDITARLDEPENIEEVVRSPVAYHADPNQTFTFDLSLFTFWQPLDYSCLWEFQSVSLTLNSQLFWNLPNNNYQKLRI